ncbi:hypothetical protein KBTX_01668 [wastewater metagenome]|uniref:Uncharacterized protein n=2 Tax=unclassified sequences TaxID=12908 RepID=A0A5B8RBL4_9ZZZZ|nr:hypothetical protein KBTEX_01668 [uncultured organism]
MNVSNSPGQVTVRFHTRLNPRRYTSRIPLNLEFHA